MSSEEEDLLEHVKFEIKYSTDLTEVSVNLVSNVPLTKVEIENAFAHFYAEADWEALLDDNDMGDLH